jgi:hypothetical protein
LRGLVTIRRAIGAAATFLVLAILAAGAQETASSADDVEAALEELLRLRAEAKPNPDLLLTASGRVRACVRTHQVQLLEDELPRLCSPDAQTSWRAQVLLAQVGLPAGWRRELKGDECLTGRVYAALRDRTTVPASLSVGTGAIDERTRRALDAVAERFRDQLSMSPEDLDAGDPEFAADYRRECAPRLRRPAEYVRAEDCTWVDVDGDMSDELVVVCDSVWSTSWLHDLAYIAVIDGEGRSRQFRRLPVGGRVRQVRSLDLDRDGMTEVAVVVEMTGGRAPVTELLIISRHGTTSVTAEGPARDLVLLTLDDATLIAARRGLDWSFPGGTASERCGALALRYDVLRFQDGVVERVMPLCLPMEHRQDE